MRQVPETVNYLLIGNGRLARHFQHYLTLLNISFQTWHRARGKRELSQRVAAASHIVLLISDRAIEEFIAENLSEAKAMLIHCSGSLHSSKAYGAHPLMTFGSELYSSDIYQSIPFMIDESAPTFAELLPGLPNEHARLSEIQKAKYHALCVLGGNFSCLLWQKVFQSFETEFNLPAFLVHPYLKQQMKNLLDTPETALTGPLVRNDEITIAKNLASLVDDPFQEVYESFVKCYRKMQEAT